MNCPDETTFAKLQLGQLNPSEVASMHRHLDACPVCLELASLLGCLGPSQDKDKGGSSKRLVPGAETPPRVRMPNARPTVDVRSAHTGLVAAATLLAGHLYFALKLLPIALGSLEFDVTRHDIGVGIWPTLRVVFGFGCVLWSTVGLLWGAAALVSLIRRRSGAPRTTFVYACAALLSGALVPLAIFVMLAYKSPRLD